MHRYLTLTLLLSMMALNACGTKGSLYLPPQQKTQPTSAPVTPVDTTVDTPVIQPGSGTATPSNP
jgi:predicted small lipoprotein YifL